MEESTVEEFKGVKVQKWFGEDSAGNGGKANVTITIDGDAISVDGKPVKVSYAWDQRDAFRLDTDPDQECYALRRHPAEPESTTNQAAEAISKACGLSLA